MKCYHLSCRTVDIHPLYPQYLATSSSCGYTSIWDLRKVKKDSKNSSDSEIKAIANIDAALCHLGDDKRRLFSAFFSPVTGNGLLTTSSDDYIRLYDTSKLAQAASSSTYRVETSIRHDNRTGRWITPFRAVWHPQRDDAFVVGSMGQPRQVEVYGRHGRLLAAIGSNGPLPINTICSVNAFHPHRLVLASADSAGRVHVFL
ncbi:hypothetical protein J437_LFUL001702 [Ladona fulva]|uniref:WD repeat-containing protein 76 n=1 Tax=Ladona fulva TaxID=123851 RepID=A0A8K0K726_LADFU|nr:hypothetical protein J437_LFUL001702 [Ladona fulva]